MIWKSIKFIGKLLEKEFPYIFTSLKIYLNFFIANCSAERAFSKLTRIENNIGVNIGKLGWNK